MSTGYRFVYTDPMWAVGESGDVEPRLADLERHIFGPDVTLDLGLHRGAAFVREGRDFLEHVRGADALVIYRTQVTEELMDALSPTCKIVARQGVGFDNLNVPLLKRRGVFGFNVSDYCVDEVSTHTLAMVLALERRLCAQNDALKRGTWDIFFGGYPRRTNDLTFGIVGFGRIGRATARKAQPFYGRVLAHDPYVQRDLMRGYGVDKQDRLEDLLGACDVIVLHALLHDETRFMINARSLAAVKPGALLVNTARGQLVEPEAVLAALTGGRLGGYGADVFSPEDPNAHPSNQQLLRFDNVVVTSHRAFLSDAAEKSQRTRVAEQVLEVLRTGAPPRFDRIA